MQSDERLQAMFSCLSTDDIGAANNFALEILKSDAECASAWYVVGKHHLVNGNFDAAETSYKCVTTIAPDSPEGWLGLCESLYGLGKFESALTACVRALQLDPSIQNFALYFRFSMQFKTNEVRDEIYRIMLKALAKEPTSTEYYLLLSRYYIEASDLEKASNAYLMATGCDAENITLQRSFGSFLLEIGSFERSASVFLHLIDREPDNAENWEALAFCYLSKGNLEQAIEANLKAIDLNPDLDRAKINAALVYGQLTDYERAKQHLEDIASGLNPRFKFGSPHHLGVYALHMYFARYLGEMGVFPDSVRDAFNNLRIIDGQASIPVSPFSMLPLMDSPEVQYVLCKARNKGDTLIRKRLPHVERLGGKIRVGWFGSDFYSHATMFLLSGVFRLFDKEKFEFLVYDYGRKRDAVTEELVPLVDAYHDLEGADDKQIIELARSHELDIAVDLKGYTGGGKTKIFAAGLAPLQVYFLGYPGTSGQEYMDYMVADKITVPKEFRKHYSEKMIYMPNSYQPNDSQRLKKRYDTNREDWGLDPKAVVFASFNQIYKVSPEEVRVWAKLLLQVGDSQLWFLCSGNPDWYSKIQQNVLKEFSKHGVSQERLVFAYPVPIDEHLSRLSHADLFLDSFFVNGHTTVSDALFAGVPVITKLGRQFAARVGASLVSAAGCGELIANSEEDYFQLAFTLATDETYRREIKLKLSGVTESALYDTERYVADLERGFEEAVAMSREGRQPQDLWG